MDWLSIFSHKYKHPQPLPMGSFHLIIGEIVNKVFLSEVFHMCNITL